MRQFQEFADKYDICIQVVPKTTRTDNLADGWPDGSSHYRVRVGEGPKCKDGFSVWFTMGPAHTKQPTVTDILEALHLDCYLLSQEPTFEEWCRDWGYDPDSRKAERTYKACMRTCESMEALLGWGVFQEFMNIRDDE